MLTAATTVWLRENCLPAVRRDEPCHCDLARPALGCNRVVSDLLPKGKAGGWFIYALGATITILLRANVSMHFHPSRFQNSVKQKTVSLFSPNTNALGFLNTLVFNEH